MKVFDSGLLRIARRNSGFTLKEVADTLFISASCIAGKENGSIRVFADELPLFSKLYGVDIETFFANKLDESYK